MMKILVYGNRKQPSIYWDVSDPERARAAFRCLFDFLDKEWDVYEDLKDDTRHKDTILYQRAQAGDDESLLLLLRRRKDYEYERWELAEVRDPLRRDT